MRSRREREAAEKEWWKQSRLEMIEFAKTNFVALFGEQEARDEGLAEDFNSIISKLNSFLVFCSMLWLLGTVIERKNEFSDCLDDCSGKTLAS